MPGSSRFIINWVYCATSDVLQESSEVNQTIISSLQAVIFHLPFCGKILRFSVFVFRLKNCLDVLMNIQLQSRAARCCASSTPSIAAHVQRAALQLLSGQQAVLLTEVPTEEERSRDGAGQVEVKCAPRAPFVLTCCVFTVRL